MKKNISKMSQQAPRKKNSPTLAELQRQVDEWITTTGIRYFDPMTNMALLTEEVGEVARVMARKYGEQSAKPGEHLALDEELADVLFVICCLANQCEVDLTQAMEHSFAKKTNRDARRHRDNLLLNDED